MGMKLKVKRSDHPRHVLKRYRETLSSMRRVLRVLPNPRRDYCRYCRVSIGSTVENNRCVSCVCLALRMSPFDRACTVSVSRFHTRVLTRATIALRISPQETLGHLHVVGNDDRTIRCCRTRVRATPPILPMTHAHLLI